MAAARNEHLVVVMLEPLPPGEEFEIWPMHITLVPWFPCDNRKKLDEVLAGVAGRHARLTVTIGKAEMWGDKDKFKVLKVDDKGGLYRLHWDVFQSLEKNNFPIHQKDYLGEKYTPHITLRNQLSDEGRFKPGQLIRIEQFNLIEQVRLKGSGRMIKTAVKNYELG